MRRLLFLYVLLLCANAQPSLAAHCPQDHPRPPRWWHETTFDCRGRVHVISADPRASEIVFAEWSRLLENVKRTPLAPLTARPEPVFVHVYPTAASCTDDLDRPYVVACYEPHRRLARVGFNQPDEGGEDRFRQILRHELAHHLLHGARSDSPRWLSEGFAESFEPLDASLDDAPPTLPLTELLAWEGPNFDGVHRHYKASRTLVGGLLSSEAHGAAFADRVLSSSPWPRRLDPLLDALDVEVGDLHREYERQRNWRRASGLERNQQFLAAQLTTSWGGEPWMLLVGAALVALVGLSLRVAPR